MSAEKDLRPVSVADCGPLTFTCCACEKRTNQAHGTVYADLLGVPFRAYYCADCARKEQT